MLGTRAQQIHLILKLFFCWYAPFGFLYFSSFSNEPEMGTEINPGMVMTPFPSSTLGQNSNPQPYNHESNLLTTRLD